MSACIGMNARQPSPPSKNLFIAGNRIICSKLTTYKQSSSISARALLVTKIEDKDCRKRRALLRKFCGTPATSFFGDPILGLC